MRNLQILIVSAVKICKQCLQTVSASGGLCHHTPYFAARAPTEASLLDPTGGVPSQDPQDDNSWRRQWSRDLLSVGNPEAAGDWIRFMNELRWGSIWLFCNTLCLSDSYNTVYKPIPFAPPKRQSTVLSMSVYVCVCMCPLNNWKKTTDYKLTWFGRNMYCYAREWLYFGDVWQWPLFDLWPWQPFWAFLLVLLAKLMAANWDSVYMQLEVLFFLAHHAFVITNRRAIAMMFVRLFVCLSVCLSGTGMHCDDVHLSADLSLWLHSAMFWAPWHQTCPPTQTLSNPLKPNGHTSKCTGPYWSNPPFLIFGHSGTVALRAERQSARMSEIEYVG